jgi:hypothetical protein
MCVDRKEMVLFTGQSNRVRRVARKGHQMPKKFQGVNALLPQVLELWNVRRRFCAVITQQRQPPPDPRPDPVPLSSLFSRLLHHPVSSPSCMQSSYLSLFTALSTHKLPCSSFRMSALVRRVCCVKMLASAITSFYWPKPCRASTSCGLRSGIEPC